MNATSAFFAPPDSMPLRIPPTPGPTMHEISRAWSHDHHDAIKSWQEQCARERAAEEKAWIEKLERKLHARRAAKNAAALKAATSGRGWRVLDRSHTELEAFAKRVWDLGLHAIPWPAGWRVRWADLSGAQALGMCVKDQKLILLDERLQFRRTGTEFETTVVHEIAHLLHPDEDHGSGFHETFRRLLAYVLPEPDARADGPAPIAARPRPEPPPIGARFFNGRPLTTPDGWEIRAGSMMLGAMKRGA